MPCEGTGAVATAAPRRGTTPCPASATPPDDRMLIHYPLRVPRSRLRVIELSRFLDDALAALRLHPTAVSDGSSKDHNQPEQHRTQASTTPGVQQVLLAASGRPPASRAADRTLGVCPGPEFDEVLGALLEQCLRKLERLWGTTTQLLRSSAVEARSGTHPGIGGGICRATCR